MRKYIIATLAALTLGTAVLAQPAEARCFWNGFATICRPGPGPFFWHHRYWHHGWYR
jgi:hypothetical protein